MQNGAFALHFALMFSKILGTKVHLGYFSQLWYMYKNWCHKLNIAYEVMGYGCWLLFGDFCEWGDKNSSSKIVW